MQEIINTFAMEHLYRFAIIVVICTFAIMASMLTDLIFGIRKARQNHEATTSQGFKKTCTKAQKYFSPFLITVCIDLIASCAGIPVPVFSMLWSAYCVFCEFVSVREKAWEKAEIRKQERTMKVILENKDDIARMLMEMMRQSADNKEESEARHD